MNDLSQLVLRTDIAGMPLEWIDYRRAVQLSHQDQVGYSLGPVIFRIRGGICARTGRQSRVDVNAIIATVGANPNLAHRGPDYSPPLSNQALFKRDQNLCLYCGQVFPIRRLSRDHVTPLSQGGRDIWNNVVTACKGCNNQKAGRTPEQSHMQLLAIPFTPTHAEYIYLKGKRILADQMEFLLAHFPRNSRLRARITQSLKAQR